MFFGEYQYKLDEKGRMSVPPRFRASLKDGVLSVRIPKRAEVRPRRIEVRAE